MTIKARLWVLVLVAIAALLAVFATGKTGIGGGQADLAKVTLDLMPKLITVQDILARNLAVQRDVREYILLKDVAARQQVESDIQKFLSENSADFDYLTSVIYREEGKRLLAIAKETRVLIVASNMKTIALAKDGKSEEAAMFVTSAEVTAQRAAYRVALQNLVAFYKKLMENAVEISKEDSDSANRWMLIISILAAGILIGIALMIIHAVSAAITEIIGGVNQVVNSMSFKTRLPKRKDELDAISNGLNTMLGSLDAGVTDIANITQSLAAGDFSRRITNNYVGDLDALKQTINQSVDNIDAVITEMSKTMNALQLGQFSMQVNTNAPGAYGSMLNAASQTMQTLNAIIANLNDVMTQMIAGDFSGRVSADGRGDLLAMKNSINCSMDAIAKAVYAINEMAKAQAEGDLTHECIGDFKGQLEATQAALNLSARKLKEIVTQSISASNIVNDAANQVSQGSADLSARVQEQAAALEETSATMNEMATAVQANTANARRVADLTNQVQAQAKDGVDVMQQTIGAMQSIKESSSKINDIVTIIDSIAFQTNLLALNAAVEAARAGEHGRGFAVVASEVRALAGKSADAAKDIKTLITDSVTRIENGTHLADKSGEMLNTIAGSIHQVAGMIDQIANASNEQSVGIGQVHRAIADIDKVTQENAALVEETTAAAASLGTEASSLRNNMSFFKTGQAPSNAHRTAPRQPVKSATSRPAPTASKKVAALPAPKKANSEEWGEF